MNRHDGSEDQSLGDRCMLGVTPDFSGFRRVEGVRDSHHGQWIPFWQQACQQDRAGACRYLALLHTNACHAGSG